jgi:SNF2 family DNA or RNA helicase
VNINLPHYLSLVVCGKRLRSQWRAEAERFFPESKVGVIDAKNMKAEIEALLTDAAAQECPATAIVSYEAVTANADFLSGFRWDDLVVDEAVVLKNPNSQRSQALWQLRETSTRGIALTGTPIDRDLDDLGAIVAWTRGDREMFHGIRLSKRFDATSPKSVDQLLEALGPTVFRRDRSEIADELPQIQTETILIDPDPAELALANGARHKLREMLQNLDRRVQEAAELEPNNPQLQEAQEALRTLRGTALGGVTLARMAACDPAAVAASKSEARELLNAEGLIEPALAVGGTKRKQIAALTDELCQTGEAVLIFTEFSSLAANLVSDLTAAGVRVGSIQGGMTEKATSEAQEGFQGGKGGAIGDNIKYDCLVLTKAAREGLNLQRASVVIHYDLPWKASDMTQRVGRASRIGSSAKTLQVIIPVMAGTIEERAAKMLVKRGVTALAVLDDPRGVDTSQTDLAQALSGLADVVSDDELEVGDAGMLDLARKLIEGQ